MTDQSLEELAARRKEREAQLQAAPIAVIEGVVGPGGVSAGKFGRETLWSINMTLEVWRLQGGALQSQPLHLVRRGDDAELERYQLAARGDYPLVRLKARLMMETGSDRPEAWLEEIPEVIEEAELAEHAARLQVSVIHDDAFFGPCTLDRQVQWFEAQAPWNGSSIVVYLQAETLEALPQVLEQARALWRDQTQWHARVLDCAVENLLELKNDSWLEDDEKPVAADAFRQRIELQSISMDEEGWFEFCFGDDDLFWGHAILVRGTLEDGPEDADIAG